MLPSSFDQNNRVVQNRIQRLGILPWMAAEPSCGNAFSEKAQTMDNSQTDRRIASIPFG